MQPLTEAVVDQPPGELGQQRHVQVLAAFRCGDEEQEGRRLLDSVAEGEEGVRYIEGIRKVGKSSLLSSLLTKIRSEALPIVPVYIAAANASANDLTETVVYYASADLEGAARGVAQLLPEADVRLSEQFAATGTPLVVVLGADYAASVAG